MHFVSQKKMLFFFFFFFSRQVSKRWQVESFESIRKRECCFSRRFLISKSPTGHAFYFLTRPPPITRSYSSPSFVETSFFSLHARVISAKWFPFIATRCSLPLVSRFITREEVKLRGFMVVVEVRLEDVFWK